MGAAWGALPRYGHTPWGSVGSQAIRNSPIGTKLLRNLTSPQEYTADFTSRLLVMGYTPPPRRSMGPGWNAGPPPPVMPHAVGQCDLRGDWKWGGRVRRLSRRIPAISGTTPIATNLEEDGPCGGGSLSSG